MDFVTIVFAIMLIVMIVSLVNDFNIYNHFLIKLSANLLRLDDRGEINSCEELSSSGRWIKIHHICGTRLRIGLTVEDEPVEYCWHCEEIIGPYHTPNPGGKEPIPEDETLESSDDNIVVHFNQQKKAG